MENSGPRKQRIRGAKRTKGRTLSGHADAIEVRTFQDSAYLEHIDRLMRKWRAEPHTDGLPSPEVNRVLTRLERAVDNHSLHPVDSDSTERTRRQKKHGKAPTATKSTTVERSLGGWVYTIRLPGGEIIGKRKEV